MRRAAALVFVLLSAPAVQAQTVTIAAGDKITIGDTAYRFLGAEAPDPRQVCDDGYPAGQEAIKALQRLLQGRRIACDARGRDPSGRSLATCTADGRDLGEAMIRAGMAWADPRIGASYRDVEHDAQGDRLGVHDHACILPWKWRANPR